MNRSHGGFSLLEVIIATAILAASGMMLMSIFSMGDRHTQRADERTIAQMLCQSKLEELLADRSQLIPIQAEVIRQYPGWVSSVALKPTQLEGFVQLTVSVTRIPGMATGADLDLASTSSEEASSVTAVAENVPDKPTFQLVRWLPFEGDVSLFAEGSSGGTSRSSSGGY